MRQTKTVPKQAPESHQKEPIDPLAIHLQIGILLIFTHLMKCFFLVLSSRLQNMATGLLIIMAVGLPRLSVVLLTDTSSI